MKSKKKQAVKKEMELDPALLNPTNIRLAPDHRTEFQKKKLRVLMGHEKF